MSYSVGRLLMHDAKVRLGEPRHPHDGHVVEVIDGPTVRPSNPGVTYYKVTCHDCSKKARSEFYTFETMENWLTAWTASSPDDLISEIAWETDGEVSTDERLTLMALTALAAALDYVDPVEAAVNVMTDPELRDLRITPHNLRLVIERMKEG